MRLPRSMQAIKKPNVAFLFSFAQLACVANAMTAMTNKVSMLINNSSIA